MSNRHSYEEASIARVISFLKTTRGIGYQITDEHVHAGRKNCDYILSGADGSKIAVEIVRLVNSSKEMEQHSRRSRMWKALEKECSSRGISGFDIQIPWELGDQPLREIERTIAPKVALEAATRIQLHENVSDFEINGFHFRRTSQPTELSHFSINDLRWIDSTSSAAAILETLADKDAQLALAATERFLVVVPQGIDLDAAQISWELALRDDLVRIQYADLVIHVPSHDDVSVIYAKTVRDFFANRAPLPENHTILVDKWLCARLSIHYENIFSTIKEIHNQKGSLNNLSAQAKSTLGYHGINLVKLGQQESAVWIVRQLHSDPHPLAGEDDTKNAFTTVRGSIARLLSEIIFNAKASELTELLDFARQFSMDIHHGVRKIAAYSIRALMIRRELITANDNSLPTEEIRAAIKGVWINYIKSASTRDLISAAQRTLDAVHDISKEDAEFVIEALHCNQGELSDEIFARFLIYFAFIRSSNPGMDNFTDTDLRHCAEQLIQRQADLRKNVAFAFKSSVKNHPEIRDVLKPLLTVLLRHSCDERSLLFTLDGATTLAIAGLIVPTDEDSFLHAMTFAGPFNPYEADAVANGIRNFVKSLEEHRSTVSIKTTIETIRDSNLRKALRQHTGSI